MMISFQEDGTRSHILSPEAVVELYESTNQPHVQPAGLQAQPAQGAVVALRRGRQYELLVVLTLTQAGRNVIYASQPFGEQEYGEAFEEATLFAESMGFLLDQTGWPSLDAASRSELAGRLGCFRGPRAPEVQVAERRRPTDPLAAVARLAAIFSVGLAVAAGPFAGGCSGPSQEQRQRAAEIHFDLGTNSLTNGDARGALGEYLEAEKQDPDLPELQNALGLLYGFSLAKPAEAETHFKRALALREEFSEAANNYGALLLQQSRWAEAALQFELALKNPLYPQRPVAECNLGWALAKMGKPEAGVGRIRAALRFAPKYCMGWRQLGLIQGDRGEAGPAAEALEKYAQSCPESAEAHLQLGKAWARLGKVEEARGALGRCAEKARVREPALAEDCDRLLQSLGGR